ncbi:unnamed protein product, partial [Protopolystoma xenopodis]
MTLVSDKWCCRLRLRVTSSPSRRLRASDSQAMLMRSVNRVTSPTWMAESTVSRANGGAVKVKMNSLRCPPGAAVAATAVAMPTESQCPSGCGPGSASASASVCGPASGCAAGGGGGGGDDKVEESGQNQVPDLKPAGKSAEEMAKAKMRGRAGEEEGVDSADPGPENHEDGRRRVAKKEVKVIAEPDESCESGTGAGGGEEASVNGKHVSSSQDVKENGHKANEQMELGEDEEEEKEEEEEGEVGENEEDEEEEDEEDEDDESGPKTRLPRQPIRLQSASVARATGQAVKSLDSLDSRLDNSWPTTGAAVSQAACTRLDCRGSGRRGDGGNRVGLTELPEGVKDGEVVERPSLKTVREPRQEELRRRLIGSMCRLIPHEKRLSIRMLVNFSIDDGDSESLIIDELITNRKRSHKPDPGESAEEGENEMDCLTSEKRARPPTRPPARLLQPSQTTSFPVAEATGGRAEKRRRRKRGKTHGNNTPALNALDLTVRQLPVCLTRASGRRGSEGGKVKCRVSDSNANVNVNADAEGDGEEEVEE